MDRKNMTEADLEKVLYSSRFTNSSHKEALREKLFFSNAAGGSSEIMELSLDELDMAAGGRTSIPELEDELKKISEDENSRPTMNKKW